MCFPGDAGSAACISVPTLHSILISQYTFAMSEQIHKGWYQRGYMPHFDAAGMYQMITYRTADSLPQELLQQAKHNLGQSDGSDRKTCKKMELWLDKGMGACVLANNGVASIIKESWKYWDTQRYDLLNWVIMPNHVHLLLKQYDEYNIATIVHSWKSYTGQKINKLLGCRGAFWAIEYWDRYIRDERHFIRAMDYIDQNPVKAGLVNDPSEWPHVMAKA